MRTPGISDPALDLAVFLPERLLVDLSDARLGKRFNEQNAVRDSEFRDHSGIGGGPEMRLYLRVAGIVACLGVPDDERNWPLAPFVVLDADDGGFRHSLALRDEIFDLERRHPFAASLDDILDSIDYTKVAAGLDHADVVRVQVAAGPQLPGRFSIVDISLGEP